MISPAPSAFWYPRTVCCYQGEPLTANAYYVENFRYAPARLVQTCSTSARLVQKFSTDGAHGGTGTRLVLMCSTDGAHGGTSKELFRYNLALPTPEGEGEAEAEEEGEEEGEGAVEKEKEKGEEVTLTALLRTLSPAYVGLYLLDLPPNVKPWSTDNVDPVSGRSVESAMRDGYVTVVPFRYGEGTNQVWLHISSSFFLLLFFFFLFFDFCAVFDFTFPPFFFPFFFLLVFALIFCAIFDLCFAVLAL